MRVELPGKVGFHQPVEELDVLRQRRSEFIGRAVLIGRGNRADELAVIESIVDARAGERLEVRVLDLLPETEEGRHRGDERRRLRAEYHRQLADGLVMPAIQLDIPGKIKP